MQGEVYGDFALSVSGGATLVPARRGGCCRILVIMAGVIGVGIGVGEVPICARGLSMPFFTVDPDRRARDDVRPDGSGRAALTDGDGPAGLMVAPSAVPSGEARDRICASFAG